MTIYTIRLFNDKTYHFKNRINRIASGNKVFIHN